MYFTARKTILQLKWNGAEKSVEICRENNYAKRKICKKMKKFAFFCNEMGKK